MRPIERGDAPQLFTRYEQAKPELVRRLGAYCSYCERRIPTGLAVEHMLAQSLHDDLRLEWSNFLLACVNCNSCKKNKLADLQRTLFPDRDNTFHALVYCDQTGIAEPAPCVTEDVANMARAMIDLVKLNCANDDSELGSMVALDRLAQRREAWENAKEARFEYDQYLFADKDRLIRATAREAVARGFFSIWMAAFEGVPAVRQAFIDAFPGTAKDCFDVHACPVSPRPDNGLVHAGKV